QDLRIIIPEESDEVIDLCEDDALDDLSQQTASAVSAQDDDNVIFVSYIPPTSEAQSPHDLIAQTGTSSLNSVTEEKSLDGRTGGDGRDDGSALNGKGPDHSILVSTVKNITHVCGSAVMNMHNNGDSNIENQQSASIQQVERMEADEETEADNSSGSCSQKQEDTHKMEVEYLSVFGRNVFRTGPGSRRVLRRSETATILKSGSFDVGNDCLVKGNTQTMDPPDRLEIYIPVEAEVKNIPLWSLPNSVLRRMGLPLSDSEGSRNLTGSPEGIWICPVVIRKKGQKPASQTGNGVAENMSSLLSRRFRAAPGPLRMSFVSSNKAAHEVLKDITPGKKMSTHRSHTSPFSQGSAPQTCQTAVVIYQGCIYLSIRKPNRSQSQLKTRDPQPAAQSSIPSTSSSKSQKKELLNDNRTKKKHTTCKVTHHEKKKDVTHKVRDVSSSRTAHSVPQSTDRVHSHSHRHKDARGERAVEEAAAPEPAWFQSEGEQEVVVIKDSGECEMQGLDGDEAESTSQNNDMDSNMQIQSGEFNQSSSESCTRRAPLGAAFVPPNHW
ncbi:ligand-dependent nuclear receptor-interacting factor 1, partial [Lates japonicus]